MTKIEAASQEEHDFAAKVNLALEQAGGRASVSPFCRLDEDTQARMYGLVFSCGSKRHTITADAPFHYDSPDDVVARVKQWIATAGGRELYSDNPKYAVDFEG